MKQLTRASSGRKKEEQRVLWRRSTKPPGIIERVLQRSGHPVARFLEKVLKAFRTRYQRVPAKERNVGRQADAKVQAAKKGEGNKKSPTEKSKQVNSQRQKRSNDDNEERGMVNVMHVSRKR